VTSGGGGAVRRRLAALLLAAGPWQWSCARDAAGPEGPGCGGTYPAQASSPYVLPYSVGSAFVVDQGNCSDGSHGPGTAVRFAYDFLMPIGTPVVAAREGVVLLVTEVFEDGNRTPGRENFVNVVHDDGTIAAYVHLTRDGALVGVGDRVDRGQVIATSGDTGASTEPHLHFHVQGCSGCGTVAVTFRNTRPHPGGLVAGETYRAEPAE
jgi:murein DD-endopeptidase MepM/ murein hydrolase activator NlpD